MSYEDWRKQFSSDEEAARKGFEQAMDLAQEVAELRNDVASIDIAYCAAINQRDALYGNLRECLGWLEADTFDYLRDLLHGQAGYPEMYTSCDKLRNMLEDAVSRSVNYGDGEEAKEP